MLSSVDAHDTDAMTDGFNAFPSQGDLHAQYCVDMPTLSVLNQ